MGLATAVVVGGALLGAYAGSQKQTSSQTQTSNVNAGYTTRPEQEATDAISKNFKDLQGMVDLGPGNSDVTAGVESQRSLAKMLESYSQGGYAPTAQDMELAKAQTAPQQVALEQQMRSIREQAARQQALAGRGPTDFVFNNKLNQNQLDLTQQLAAQQSQIASQQPFQRLGFAENLAQIRSGLASQAMQNRQAILGLGSQIQSAERNFRLGTASRSGTQTTESGGGTAGAIKGGIAGAGAAMGVANYFGGPSSAPATDAAGGTTSYSADYLNQPSSMGFSNYSAPSFSAAPISRAPSAFSGARTSFPQAPINYGQQMGPSMSTQPYYQPLNSMLNPFGGY
jgi:hypothetical protein